MPAVRTCSACGRELAPVDPARSGVCPSCEGVAATSTLLGLPRPSLSIDEPMGLTRVGMRRPARPKEAPPLQPPPLHPPAPPAVRVGEFAAGQKLGKYTVESLLGEGPVSSVYLVQDGSGKRMALKIVHDDLPFSCTERLEAEARHLRQVRHYGVVGLRDVGTHGGRAFLVREYLHGRSLKQLLEDTRESRLRRLTTAEQLWIFRQLAEALQALHGAQGRLIHRHLMPEHVILVRPMRPVLVGCGLMRSETEPGSEKERGLGTPVYMSPEQLDGILLDERSDMFSLGLLMFELITGSCLGGKSAAPPWLASGRWHAPLPRSYDPKLPRPMEDAILRCLEVDTFRRCRDAGVLLQLLRAPPLEALLADGSLPAQRITDDFDRAPAKPAPPVPSGPRPHASVLAALQHYDVERLLHAEPGNETYLARRRGSDRRVLVRRLSTPSDPGARAWLQRRIVELAELSHPRLLTLIDVVLGPELTFLVLEHAEGDALSTVLTKIGQLNVDAALTIFADLLDALEPCHARGVLHRGIEPACVLVESDGHARLTDFRMTLRDERARSTNYSLDDRALRAAGYLPPEEIDGGEPDARSDLYRCGLVLYEMLTGKPAISAITLETTYALVLKKAPIAVKFFHPDCSASLVAFVQNLLEKRPAARYASVAEARVDLAAVRAGGEVRRHKGRVS